MIKLNMYFGFLLQSAKCSFLGMEGKLTHIQGFLRLSDNVGMFYPQNKSVPSIDPHWTPASLDATSAYLFNLSVNPCELSAYLSMDVIFHMLLRACLNSHCLMSYTRYSHARHVSHTEHVKVRSDKMAKLKTWSRQRLALFPGSSVWAEEKEPGTHALFAHAQFPQDFWEFGNFL